MQSTLHCQELLRFLHGNFEGVEFFTGLESNRLAGGDADLGASAGVAADTCLAGPDAEDAKTTKFDAFALGESLLEAFKHCVDGRFCFGARQASALDHVMDNILLDQCRRPLMNPDGVVYVCGSRK